MRNDDSAADRQFRVGDVLTVACPFTEARVVDTGWEHVSVEWPWWRVDPDSTFHHWNGVVALQADTTPGPHAEPALFRTDPVPELLTPGGLCRVGIPPTTVHITDVDHFDPPQETGWLPRPTLAVSVLPRGMSYREYPDEGHLNGIGCELHPHDDIPYTLDLVFRPYAFLMPGDEVADTAGRAWRFDGPWDWYAFDSGSILDTPRWPLTLLTRAGSPCTPEAATAVADATTTGSHPETLARWRSLTDATVTPAGAAAPRR
ncbi:hypothetical protein [Streptomyces sp. NPDC012510]|uniref:hypothetical protein n=1 Tax=Streptomyces sp. NPDC012510 TaxID=3364838 RepID=UPI0036EEBD00